MHDSHLSLKVFPRLPLLEYVEELFDAKSSLPLAGFSVLCIQHLLASTGSLICSLSRCGADLSQMQIIGKGYSTNSGVLDILRECGIRMLNPTFFGAADEPYDAILAEAVESAFAYVRNGPCTAPRKLLLLDDGGHAISRAHKLLPPDFTIMAVEQTTRGIRAASALAPRFPIINVGRSRAKLHLEAPLIAASMVDHLTRLLASGRGLFGEVHEVFLIGYGVVGRAVARRLRALGYDVVVFDTAAESRQAAAADGFPIATDLQTPLARRCVVAASTGGVSFPAGLHGILRSGSVLANMGSSDLEFAAWELRDGQGVGTTYNVEGHELARDSREAPWNRHYKLTAAAGYRYLLKGGFPVDFDGGADPIPPSSIQLTRALLLAGVLQASSEMRSGVVQLDDNVQRLIIDQYIRLASNNHN
ncbi:NAD(P)-binding domain-containing protein [Actinoplanes sp. NPDC026623]|uniref:NAD(P)-binding domain-containing protein n=1 Tax=Actinoplanes sp. NPDC026623 TaxID=3155610 RepID=UPI003403F64A